MKLQKEDMRHVKLRGRGKEEEGRGLGGDRLWGKAEGVWGGGQRAEGRQGGRKEEREGQGERGAKGSKGWQAGRERQGRGGGGGV